MGCTAIEQPRVVCEDWCLFLCREKSAVGISHMEGHAAEEANLSMAELAEEVKN